MSYPPTPAQLGFLKKLKYAGPPPMTKQEASWLIDARKAGKKGARLQKAFTAWRNSNQKKTAKNWIANQKICKQGSLEMARQSHGAIVGFVIPLTATCVVMKQYAGAYLPLQVAQKYRDLLPPGRNCKPGICDCSCEFDEVTENKLLSPNMQMIVSPGKMVPVGSGDKKKSRRGCGCLLILLLLLIIILYWATKGT